MADIALVTINAKWIHPSRALRLLKANLGPLEDRAEILEFALRQPLAEKTAPILAARPRILGISVSIWNHLATMDLLKALEPQWEAAGRPLIVIGGPEVSHLPRAGEIFQLADWVIRGEGETAFRELCEGLLNGTPGLLNRTPNLLTHTPQLPDRVPENMPGQPDNVPGTLPGKIIEARPPDLALLDPAYRLYTDEDLRRKLVYVEASRGCPFGCEFCQSALDREVREFPLDRFLEDMDGLIRRGARTFKFLDRSFNFHIPRARRILEFFLDHLPPRAGLTPAESAPGEASARKAASIEAAPGEASARKAASTKPPFQVHFEMVPSRFPPELRELLTQFPPGTLRLEVGIQTLNPETAALIHRQGSAEEALEAVMFLRNHTHAIVHADLIAGLPGEGLESFAQGFDRLWQALNPAEPGRPAAPVEIQLGILKCLPGTPIIRHNETHRMRYAPDPPYEVLETAALPAAELNRIKNFARFWELILNRDAFPNMIPVLFPPGQKIFAPFMDLSGRLLQRFGRNWGIDRNEIRQALEEAIIGFEIGKGVEQKIRA